MQFDGDVTVAGTGVLLTVNPGVSLQFTGDTIQTDLEVQSGASVGFDDGLNLIDGAVSNQGTLAVVASTLTSPTMRFANGFTNFGLILLDSTNGGVSRSATFDITTGSLFNQGQLAVQNSGGNGGDSRTINADIVNQNLFRAATDTTLNGGSSGLFDNEFGSIFLENGATLDVRSAIRL